MRFRKRKDKRKVAERIEDQKFMIKYRDPDQGTLHHIMTIDDFPDASEIYDYVTYSGVYTIYATKPKQTKIAQYNIEDLPDAPSNWPKASKKGGRSSGSSDSDDVKKLKKAVKKLMDEKKKREEEERFKRLEDKFDKLIESRSGSDDVLKTLKIMKEMQPDDSKVLHQMTTDLYKAQLEDLKRARREGQGGLKERIDELMALKELGNLFNPQADPTTLLIEKGFGFLHEDVPAIMEAWADAEEAKKEEKISLEEAKELQEAGVIKGKVIDQDEAPDLEELEVEDAGVIAKHLPRLVKRIQKNVPGMKDGPYLWAGSSDAQKEQLIAMATAAEENSSVIFNGLQELRDLVKKTPTGEISKEEADLVAEILQASKIATAKQITAMKTPKETKPYIDKLVKMLDVVLSDAGKKYIMELLGWVKRKSTSQ